MFTIFCTLPFSSTQGFFCPWPQKFLSFFFLFFITASLWCISEYWLSLKSLNSIYLFYMLSLHLLFNAHSFQALISFRIRIWSYVWIDLLFFSFLSLSWFFFFWLCFSDYLTFMLYFSCWILQIFQHYSTFMFIKIRTIGTEL